MSELVGDVSKAGVNQSIKIQTTPSSWVTLIDAVQVPTLKPTRKKRLVKKKHSVTNQHTRKSKPRTKRTKENRKEEKKPRKRSD